MQLEKYTIDELNQPLLTKHQRDFNHIITNIQNPDDVLQKLRAFNIAIPSWALGM
jgi:L-rhamnose isomerase/sugar isomerase